MGWSKSNLILSTAPDLAISNVNLAPHAGHFQGCDS